MEEKKPRWEVKYNQYKNETAKYENMKKELKTLKEGKVTGNFKTKQEYQDAVDKRNKEISEKEKVVLGYDNFKKNEKKIENILEYRNKLQGELDNLPKDNKENIANKQAEINKNEKTLEEQENRLDELIKYVNSNPNSKDLVEKQEDLSITVAVVKNLKEQRGKLDGELQQLESEQKAYEEKVEPNKAVYERKIAKCNIIAANLLKGKELGDFEIKVEPEGKRFTSPDGKLPKETNKAREENKVKENSKAEKLNEEEYGEPEPIENTEIKTEEKEPAIENVELGDEEADVEKNEEENAIAEVSTFAERHPRLAKITQFFKNIGTGVANRIKGIFKKEDVSKTDSDSAKADKESDKDNKEYEELVELVNPKKEDKGIDVEIDDKENEFLKEIAEKGEDKALEDRREAFRKQLAQRKLDAANEYAQKYGGRYEKQDGATAKKIETPEKEDEGR